MNRLIIVCLIGGALLFEAASLAVAIELVLAMVAQPPSQVGACMNG